ncbi:6-chlorohydroxyquinol-1,2-dioxygenase [Mesorhizobium sp. CU2]|uniref:dioxygenase family protein n=1 Tax=unclassified Mesorhizobium TaxID=325217 RepID=UPI00112DB184|nr:MULTISPECIES: dioxygenase [unclassified Mesorhizobium]TPN89397.1 6-chlorohydroxyquinol-1,2-dioxygenase [Mesorhizobium sp. CU3]TPO22240.1 6-chlorohydroxyquinol-1,2-dioxygenase [Mesorhizobium sp. CU2]
MADTWFSEANSAELVVERLKRHADGALPKFLVSLVEHLHLAVRETRPTAEDWRNAIKFLTEVGHASDAKRQEWVLLSDLLGVTALIEEINSRRPKGATPNTVRGPFYRADAPRLSLGANISLDGKGETLQVRGRVTDLDGGPVAHATVETWQANAQGFYENQQPDLQPEFNLRGVFQTGKDGGFHYRTVKPCGYAVPADGPVGQMLGGIGYPLRRPAHLHFIVRADGFETISTHVYDAGDPLLSEDALFGVKQELLGAFRREDVHWALDFTFVMVRARKERRAA